MLKGLFLDPRIWKIDFISSPFWNPKNFGVDIELHPSAFSIPKTGIKGKYDFVVTTEVWEISMQKTLEYLKKRGLKVILIPREVAMGKTHEAAMFEDKNYKYNGKCYFKPDLVLAPGNRYYEMWKDKVESKIVGYPRFDIYLRKDLWPSKIKILNRHGIEKNKKIIFFPSFPPYYIDTIDGKIVQFDAYDDLQKTMMMLEEYSIKRQKDVQSVIKIHPMAMKMYLKKSGTGREVSGLLEKYYKNPTKYMKVIGDNRMDGSVAREMIMISNLVVGGFSIMMLEAVMNKVPIIHTSFKQARQLKNLPKYGEKMYTITEPEQFNAAADIALSTDKMIVSDINMIEDGLFRVDGKFCERFCEEIKTICGKK